MKKFVLIFLATIEFLIFSSSSSFADQGIAVVIIDMQPQFYRYMDADGRSRIFRLMANQRALLLWAQKHEVPVIFFEFSGYGKTDPYLLEVASKNLYKIVGKNQEDGFSKNSQSRDDALNTLKTWNINRLIVSGVNGKFCVPSTTEGAINADFTVVSSDELVGYFDGDVFPAKNWSNSVCKNNRCDPKRLIMKSFESIVQ